VRIGDVYLSNPSARAVREACDRWAHSRLPTQQ
jgi:hypothetical protein